MIETSRFGLAVGGVRYNDGAGCFAQIRRVYQDDSPLVSTALPDAPG